MVLHLSDVASGGDTAFTAPSAVKFPDEVTEADRTVLGDIGGYLQEHGLASKIPPNSTEWLLVQQCRCVTIPLLHTITLQIRIRI